VLAVKERLMSSTVIVTIKYLLSEQGRRESLKSGGNGCRQQEVVGTLPNNAELDAFTVDNDGQAHFDLTKIDGLDPDFNSDILPPPEKGQWADDTIVWDIVPSFDDLLRVIRNIKAENDGMQAAYDEHREELQRAAEAFYANPKARAQNISKGYVQIGDKSFYGEEWNALVNEARKRVDADSEALKQRNRATLAQWIGQNGTENQRQRVAAGLLPWQEAYNSAEDYLYRPLNGFALYEKWKDEEVKCVCFSDFSCDRKYQSVDATELTSDEWDSLTAIKAKVPGAEFQLREHRAQCQSATETLIRRGVIVKFKLGELGFKREFLLTVEVPF
jgi:hypothetical protein